jgi:hypothetical protein
MLAQASRFAFFVLAFLTIAASASADSLTVTAKPDAPEPSRPGGAGSVQIATVTTVADAAGSVGFVSYDIGTPCPASPSPDGGNEALDSNYVQVPQGSSSTEVRLLFEKLTVAQSHVCAFLFNGNAVTAVQDVPLTRWGDVAGFNVRATAYYIGKVGSKGPQAIRFIVGCSEGTWGFPSDGECSLSGHVYLRISSKARKKFGLKSTTIFDDAFDLVDPGYGPLRMDWPVKRKVASKLVPSKLLNKMTMTLKMRAPLTKTVSGQGNLFNGTRGLGVASWDIDDRGDDDDE